MNPYSLFIHCFLISCSLLHSIRAHGQDKTGTDAFLCKSCGSTITTMGDLKSIQSKVALKYWNQTLLSLPNILVQRFENPNKRQFNVVTVSNADLKTMEEVYAEVTWFPGYSWSISICPQCGLHIGWKYQPINFNHVTHTDKEIFYGIILNNLLDETASDSLLLVPSSYKS